MTETQTTVSEWAGETFGIASVERCAKRAIEEMHEFEHDLPLGRDALLDEAADIVICLYTFCERSGADLEAEVNRKMAINRARVWRLDGTGCGYHV